MVLLLPLLLSCALPDGADDRVGIETAASRDGAPVDRAPVDRGLESVQLSGIPHVQQKPDFVEIPGGLVASLEPPGTGPSRADLAQRAMSMRELLGPDFTITVEPPYVIAGDEDSETVEARARGTVAWAHRELREDFFEADPAEPVAVWLFADDDISGMLNWRLPGLQRAIADGRTLPLEQLMSLDGEGFYESDAGRLYYAQSRYLLYHLQEEGELRAFHRAFLAGADADPTGMAALKKTLGVEDLDAFQVAWEAEVVGLGS